MTRRFEGLRAVCLVAMALAVSQTAGAGEWRIRPSFSAGQRYSDNINAAPSGAERDEFITTLNSGIAMQGRGARVRLDANYNSQRYYFMKDTRADNDTHFLTSNLNTEVVENLFFFDARASMAPTVVSNFGRITNQNYIIADQNRADVLTYTFTPRLRHRFGSFANATLSKSFNNTTAQRQNDPLNTSLQGSGSGTNLQGRLTSGRDFGRFNWGLDYSERTFTTDLGREDSTLRRTRLQGGYRLNRQWRLNGTVGQENNDFIGNNQQGSRANWSLGATWTPSPRTRIDGSWGRRAFGNTRNFDFSHRHRRINLRGRYTEDFRTTAEILQTQQVYTNVDEFGRPLTTPFDPANLADPFLPNTNLGLTNDVFVSRRLQADIGYRYRLNSFTLGFFRAEQESGRTQATEEAVGTNFNWSRPLGRRTQWSLNISHQDRSGNAGQESVRSLFISPRITHRLGQHVNTALGYSYGENTSDRGTADYRENAVFVTLGYAF
jgi:uncharacterized protein (PEP-CTERM system associated)